MNVAIILAGGTGTRTEQDIPKQFINVYEKPILLYSMEAFEKHPDIDAILVVCIEGWHEILWAYSRQYRINKLKWIVEGGESNQESIACGIRALGSVCRDDDIVLIHDGIRPMVSAEVISECIVKCRMYGSGLSAVRCQETIVRTNDGISGSEGIARSEIMRVQTPQAYAFGKAKWAYDEAEARGIYDTVYINMLMLELGEILYFANGSEKNIKITTMEDIEMFKSLIKVQREDWVK